jgi:hypothetical protein
MSILTPRFLRARPASFLVYFAVHDAFPAKRRVGFPPLVPTRSHDHRLRFTVPAHWPDSNSADLPFGRGAHARFGRCAPLLDSACSLMACNLGLCCVHSFGSRADRSPPEGASCATMSSHTCYRTSRSFHFPFWAVCSLSGTQPEFSLGRLHPHVEKDILSLFLASSQFNVLRASTRVRPPPGPTWPGCTRAEAAQDGSEDVTVRSVSVRMRCLTDGLSSDNAVDFMHAFATASRELRLA